MADSSKRQLMVVMLVGGTAISCAAMYLTAIIPYGVDPGSGVIIGFAQMCLLGLLLFTAGCCICANVRGRSWVDGLISPIAVVGVFMFLRWALESVAPWVPNTPPAVVFIRLSLVTVASNLLALGVVLAATRPPRPTVDFPPMVPSASGDGVGNPPETSEADDR